ncbi:MAG: antibiotic biosynthesis monooxygenase [Xanthomonadales bacterium]|nr:antibiotic biosynthesis monooxygenase [Xanthomonadales bacterium]NIN59207.1 antibiotic biosynthesis monooxygenase [Xanthomonadales bacterium]NIN74558.1 antibiotic biosynthesis monooxygenase [Xanthomonadales bacterium]NIO13976.1 antibiotic biosynthesis monooxygenase [Xanthomonadales bacterium]NIP11600.1 antibiotic biosynthesis monooxygenase [Xanthomonadales bacterium]
MMTFLARMKVKQDRVADFVRLAHAMTEKVHALEPDTLHYEFFKLRDEPLGYAVLERFTSEAAEEAHRNTPHFLALAPDLVDCLDGTYVREFLDPLE